MDIKENISLAKHTTFKIGGPARYFCIVKSKEDLIKAVKKAEELNLPFFILGGGSNVLALDKGYNGIVIKVQSSKLKVQNHNSKPKTICAEAGIATGKLVKLAVENSLTGLEWLAGMPGTIGGAIYGNSQAFNVRMSDIIKSVEVLDTKSLKIKNLSKKQCQFSNKNSILKKNKNLIILSVWLELRKGERKEIEKKIKENLDFRKEIQPLGFPSAGSVFLNKPGVSSSAFLIEKCGLKGTRVGGAKVSEKHAGFIVNTGKAEAKDVLDLIKIIKQKIKSKFGIDLKPEIQIIK